MNSWNVINYIDGIYTSDYDISFYDIEHDGVISYQPAYQLIQYNIDGLSPLNISPSVKLSSQREATSSEHPTNGRQPSMTTSPTPTASQTTDRQRGMICTCIATTYDY